MARPLTPKQEAFCIAYVETGNASEAYRKAYDAAQMKAASVNRKAKELLDNGKITARVAELQESIRSAHDVSVTSLLQELEDARQVARRKDHPTAMVQATIGKARLAGLLDPDPDKGVGDIAKALATAIAKLPG
ncbi:terminase small subunit [Achromobacter denitrificans]